MIANDLSPVCAAGYGDSEEILEKVKLNAFNHGTNRPNVVVENVCVAG